MVVAKSPSPSGFRTEDTGGTAEFETQRWYRYAEPSLTMHFVNEDVSLALSQQGQLAFNICESISSVDVFRALVPSDQLAKLARFRNLPEGWNSYGADRISARAIDQAVRLLGFAMLVNYLPNYRIETYSLAPLANGGVQIEWLGPLGELMVEISVDGELGYLLEYNDIEQDHDGVDERAIQQVILLLGKGQ